jgi:hypothetical protein
VSEPTRQRWQRVAIVAFVEELYSCAKAFGIWRRRGSFEATISF